MSDTDPTDVIAELLSPQFDRRRAHIHDVDRAGSKSAAAQFRMIPLQDIDDDAASVADEAELKPLAKSIAEHGLVQPLLVRRDAGRYRLLAGRNRLAAARNARLSPVPCLVHDVDAARADAIARAAGVRAVAAAASTLEQVDINVAAHVAEAVATIQSTATLLANDSSPMAHRVALDLLRAEAWRASWQLRAASIVEHTYAWNFRPSLFGAALGRVRDGFAPECRLNGIVIEMNVVDWNASADIDEEAFVCAVTGAIIASAGLAVGATPQIVIAAHQADGATATIEVTQHASLPDARMAGRFFDPSWTDRPGGWAAMVGSVVAREVARRHGGSATFLCSEHGSSLRLTFAG